MFQFAPVLLIFRCMSMVHGMSTCGRTNNDGFHWFFFFLIHWREYNCIRIRKAVIIYDVHYLVILVAATWLRAAAWFNWCIDFFDFIVARAIFGLWILLNVVFLQDWTSHLDDFLSDNHRLGLMLDHKWTHLDLSRPPNDHRCWSNDNWCWSFDHEILLFAVNHNWWLLLHIHVRLQFSALTILLDTMRKRLLQKNTNRLNLVMQNAKYSVMMKPYLCADCD